MIIMRPPARTYLVLPVYLANCEQAHTGTQACTAYERVQNQVVKPRDKRVLTFLAPLHQTSARWIALLAGYINQVIET